MSHRSIIISIDGFASTGKSTLAKRLSNYLNYNYIDTGSIYRAITLFAIKKDFFKLNLIKLDDLKDSIKTLSFILKDDLNKLYLNDKELSEEIRSHEVSEKVSQVAKISFVRSFVLMQLRSLNTNRGLVVEGRDIGTVVFPNANYKFFFKASIQARADRRWEEMNKKGIKISKKKVKENILLRDKTDTERKISPLKKPKDAIVIDTSKSTIEQVFNNIMKYIN